MLDGTGLPAPHGEQLGSSFPQPLMRQEPTGCQPWFLGQWGHPPPDRMTTRTTSPPSGTSLASSGTDLAFDPTTTSTMICLPAESSSATQPLQAQDVVLVYTLTTLMDSLKPSSAATTPTTVGTRSYLKAVSPMSGLCVVAPAFTPVGVNPVDRYTRSGAEGQAQNAPAFSQGAVSPSSQPVELAMEANRTGATEADASGIPPSLTSGGALALSVSPFGGALASSTLTSRRARTLLDGIQAVAPLVSGSPPTPPTPAIVRELLEAIGALSTCDSPAADETKSAGEWSDNETSIAKPANIDGDEDNFGSDKDIVEGMEFAGKPWQAALACRLNTRFRASERRTRSAVDRLL